MSVEENDSRDVSTRQDTTSELSFDNLARGLGSGALSRRQAMRLLGGSLLGSALALIPGVAGAAPKGPQCKPLHDKCTTNVQCCSNFCDKNGKQCSCPPETEIACNNRCVPTCHDTNNPCKISVCNPATGNCVPQDLTGTPCDTGNQCTADICQNGQCEEGPVSVTCVDEQCQRCNPATGNCDAVNNDTPCELDDNKCTLDTCQAGICTAGGLRECQQPANECQEAVCIPATGDCETQDLTGTPCDTGNKCTADICQAGQCQEGPVDVICTHLDEECKVGVCIPTTGACQQQNLTNTPCDDEDRCTTDDTCQNGVCRGTRVTCPVCQTCSAATGTCVAVTCSTTGQICCLTGPRAGTCGAPLLGTCRNNSDCCNNNCTRNPGGQACRSTDTGCLCR